VVLCCDTRPKVRKEAVAAVHRVLGAMSDTPAAAKANERVVRLAKEVRQNIRE
jgi:hypothetical protein